MNALIISLTGEVIETNFDEWKKDLLAQIDGVQKELESDADFAIATDQTKSLKQAESALKAAKQSAIEQAADIQELFAAIDEITAAARGARLFLERQIKSRKQEIKDEIVNEGIRRVRSLIDRQSDDFKLLDPMEFADREEFVDAIKWKRGVEGIKSAVEDLIDRLRGEIVERAEAVNRRASKLAMVAPEHRALFQDRGTLLALSDEDLDTIIAERIQFKLDQEAEQEQRDVAEAAGASPAKGPDRTLVTNKADKTRREHRISLFLLATQEQADDLLSEIRRGYSDRDIVRRIEIEPLPR